MLISAYASPQEDKRKRNRYIFTFYIGDAHVDKAAVWMRMPILYNWQRARMGARWQTFLLSSAEIACNSTWAWVLGRFRCLQELYAERFSKLTNCKPENGFTIRAKRRNYSQSLCQINRNSAQSISGRFWQIYIASAAAILTKEVRHDLNCRGNSARRRLTWLVHASAIGMKEVREDPKL